MTRVTVDLPHVRDVAAVEEQALSQRRLAGVHMRQDAQIADACQEGSWPIRRSSPWISTAV